MRPCGLMDRALVFGAKDCRFESCQGHVMARIMYIYIVGRCRHRYLPQDYFFASDQRREGRVRRRKGKARRRGGDGGQEGARVEQRRSINGINKTIKTFVFPWKTKKP